MAEGLVRLQMPGRRTQLAYLDVIAILAIATVRKIPLIFLMKAHKGGSATAH
jgi:hypothetical protein